ncbi:MAG: hypothetical protein K8I30_00295, partial [Anaerolineae bacterium]|nr:hypothetical protein [Anaerolineae bacterium]
TYTVWLDNTENQSILRLGDLALDALGSGALVYTDAEGRMLPASFNAARITLETRGAGYRLSSPSIQTSSGETLYRAELPQPVAAAMAEILAASPEGIEGMSLLDSAISEATTAFENSQGNYQNSLGGIYTNAEHLLNILLGQEDDYNGNGFGENPGRGLGVVFYLDRMDSALDKLPTAASVRLQSDINLIRTCLDNTRDRMTRITELQRRLLSVEVLNTALPLAEETDALLAALIAGADANENGRVEPFADECGLEQVAAFGMLIGSMDVAAAA